MDFKNKKWSPKWDLNPHCFQHDFESCASAIPPFGDA